MPLDCSVPIWPVFLSICLEWGAFFVPVILGLSGIWLLQGREPRIIWLTLLGGVILMISTGGILYLFRTEYEVLGTTILAGGTIGTVFTAFLLRYANIVGGIIILVFFWVVGLILSTGISLAMVWQFAQKKTTQLAQVIARDIKDGLVYVRQQAAEARENRKEKKTPD